MTYSPKTCWDRKRNLPGGTKKLVVPNCIAPGAMFVTGDLARTFNFTTKITKGLQRFTRIETTMTNSIRISEGTHLSFSWYVVHTTTR